MKAARPSWQLGLEFPLAAVLDRMPTAVMVFADPSQVLFANSAALAVLGAHDGIRLSPAAGSVSLNIADAAERRVFETLVESTKRMSGPGTLAMRLSRPSGKPEYVVRFDRLASSVGQKCLVSVVDPCDPHRLDAALMASAFGLTTAEARLAEELLGEDRLPEIARRLGVQQSTVRSHLLSIFRKTRTSCQTQLVKLLMALRSPG